MLKVIKKFWPYFYIIFLWLIFILPYYIGGKTSFPSTYQVNNFPLWSYFQEYWGPVKNGAMPDIIVQIFPWKHFTIESLKNGLIPFWNPYSFSGSPHLANFQTAVFSPFNIIFFILPFIDAWDILIFLQPLLAGIFMFLFLRTLKISTVGGLFGSIAFMFCGFIVVWMAYGTLSYAILFLPLVLYGINLYNQDKTTLGSFITALGIVLSIFSGHFQTTLYLLSFSFLYLVFVIIFDKKSYKLFIPFFAGILIGSVQILPSIEFYLNSVRSSVFNIGGGIPVYYLITIFSPDFFGNPVTRNDWLGQYAEWASYVGVITVLFGLYSFSRKNKYTIFFIVASLISLIFALDSSIQELIGAFRIPVLSTSNPSRAVIMLSFSICVLSGFGYDRIAILINEKKKNIVIQIFLSLAFLLSIWIYLFSGHLEPGKSQIAMRNMVIPTIFTVFFILFIFVNYLKKSKKFFIVTSLVLLIFSSYDSLRFVKKWMPFDQKESVFIDLPIISKIKKTVDNQRVFGNLEAQVGTYYHISLIEGYDPLYIESYGELISSSSTGNREKAERSVVKLNRISQNTNRVLDTLGVENIFTPISDINQSWAYPVWNYPNRYETRLRDDKFVLYKNKEALKRPTLFFDYELIKDKTKAIKRFYDKNFDFRNKLILDMMPLNFIRSKGQGVATIVKENPNYIKITVKVTNPALLFLSDNYYPGWKVKVNGKDSPLLKANYAFRAVVVPKGSSTVEFYYDPKIFFVGIIMSVVGVSIVIVFTMLVRSKNV